MTIEPQPGPNLEWGDAFEEEHVRSYFQKADHLIAGVLALVATRSDPPSPSWLADWMFSAEGSGPAATRGDTVDTLVAAASLVAERMRQMDRPKHHTTGRTTAPERKAKRDRSKQDRRRNRKH